MKHVVFALLAALTLASPGCKKKSEGKEANAKLGDFTDKMCACSTPACAEQVNQDLRKWSETQPKNQKDSMSDEDKKKSEELAKKLVDCMNKANAAGSAAVVPAGSAADATGSGAGSGAASGSAGSVGSAASAVDVPADCQTYRATIERLATCDKMPADQKDAFKNAYDAASKSWTNFSASQKDSVARTCKQANDAIVAAAKTKCGW